MGGFLYTVVILLLVLGILVFVHELGHYWAAKAFGVWVHRFAVGIGPPIKRLSFRRGETEWAIAWLPIGGDALTLIAGIMRVPFSIFVVLVAIGKGLRYVVLAFVPGYF